MAVKTSMRIKWPREFPGVHYYDKKEESAVVRVLRDGAPFRYYGISAPKQVLAFEQTARKVYRVKHAMAVNSGTGALFTAVAGLGIGPGDEVIVPSFMWVATIGAVVNANAIPVLCEVDDSLNMDPRDLEKKITARTKLIIVVHMAGAPADMGAIMKIAQSRGIAVMEDCAQCNGGSFGGRKVGTFGKVGMFSLQINKNCTTGEGGLLVTDSQEMYGKLACAHDVGVPWVQGGGPIGDYPDPIWGAGRRMSELIGAVANIQLKKLSGITRRMRASKQRIKKMLAGTPGLTFRRLNDPNGDTGCFLVFSMPDATCARQTAATMRDAGLGGTVLDAYGMHIYYHIPQLVKKVPLSPAGNPWNLPQNAQSVYSYARGACPRSDELFARSIILSIPSILTRKQEETAAKIIRHAAGC